LCSWVDKRAINKQRPFVIVEENTLVMMVKGGDAFRCLLNMDRFVLTQQIGSQNEWGIIGVNEPIPQSFRRILPWKFRGKYWGGIFPDITVEEISIDRADWVNASSIEVSHESKKVRGLRTQPERRINLKDLEIGDGNGAGVHLGIELLLRIKNPAKAVFERKGKFYQVIDAGAEQVFTAATLVRHTDDFSKVAKTANGTKGLSDLYPQEEILEKLNSNGFIQASGFEVVKFSVKGFEPNTGFTQLLSAQRDVAISAEAARVKANQVKARASEITTLAEAKSESLKSWLATAKKHGVDADVATKAFQSAYSAEAFTNPNSPVTVLVQDGATFGGLPGATDNQKNKKK
jgi:regulator of protease activity HflC (stomatin/prohibitin superfamily)